MKKFIWKISTIFLKKIDSTNQYAKKNISKYPDWTIILTKNQTDGKGAGNNIWYSEKGKNLTFSIILKSINLSVEKGYLINLFISNAIHKTLMTYSQSIWIKWPNDIILMDKKIAGILIENSLFCKKIYTSIIGIGVNVNQIQFDKKFNQASSLKKLFHKNFDIKKLFNDIVYSIQKEYLLLFNKKGLFYGEKIIRKYYINHLYMKNKIGTFFIKKKYNNSWNY
ncbi:biotin--[acetyl-CoA-carboxylase] ligase [Blattabacterium cuenoti]|uniref:biotin--[acetyl-CoA-carboxylase] ligase n=1 Tax=Blattabacterium cuenoti TaxID=1653831 RepID=UPI001EECA058|nr:biotin--[acetyl-CoA-carboxylase] ligase [Blattabacterium cuenoti]